MKKGLIPVLLFGTSMALLTAFLNFFEYKYLIGHLNTNFYTAVIAIIFTATGVWIGIHFLKPKKVLVENTYQRDEAKKKELQLNDREFEILELIAKGLTNQEIADKLFLALPTIKTHISNLYSKLDVRNRTQAIHKAQNLRLI